MCVQGPHPSLIHNELPDLPLSRRKRLFFLAYKSIQFIQFSSSRSMRYGCSRELGRIGFYPVDHALWVDLQYPSDSVVTVTLNIHANGKQAYFLRIAIQFWFRSIDGLTCVTTILLATRWIQPVFHLLFRCFTIWTLHLLILYHLRFSYSGKKTSTVGQTAEAFCASRFRNRSSTSWRARMAIGALRCNRK